jgi:hypothetical protein
MNSIFIFIDDDFNYVNPDRLAKLSTSMLIESLQGTLIGINTINNVFDYTKSVRSSELKYEAYLTSIENPTRKNLSEGFEQVSTELRQRIGDEKVDELINETIQLIKLEKNDEQDEGTE